MLKKLALHPFAGFSKKEVEFRSGLNIVVGANDIGKSTLFRAIDAALFLPSKLAKSTREGRDLLPRVLPIGGDHARLTLEFEGSGRSYRLEKSWGQGAATVLETEGGQKILQEEKVEEALRALLVLPAATFQSVLFMGQGALESTVASLQEKRESLHSLGDLLRHAVDQTAGVSVDQLRERLGEKIEAALSHWDHQRGLPEKAKGIEDPWKKGVGSVLAAYYAKETLARDARLAQSLEAERGSRLAVMQAKQEARESARAFVKANEKFVESASTRQSLAALVAKSRSESEALVHDLGKWMQAETEKKLLAPDVERLEKERVRLEEEWKASLARGKQREIAAKFEKVKAAKLAAETARKKISELPAIKPEQLQKVRLAFQEVDRLKNSLKSGRLQLQFQVKREFDVSVRKDLESERRGTMVPGKPMTIHAGGRIQLLSDFFELQVTSGDGAAAEVEQQLGAANDYLGKVLAELSVKTLEEAQLRQEQYAEAVQALKSAEALLHSLLGPQEKFEELERQVGVASASGAFRDPELVQTELQIQAKSFHQKREGLVRAESMLKDLEARYGVSQSAQLTEKMVCKKSELAGLEAKLQALPALPEQAGSAEDFLPRFRRAQLEDGTLGDEIRALAVELAELKAKMPEQSAEDLERARLEAESSFQRELAHALALLRVKEAIEAVDAQGADLYVGFRTEFEKQVSRLSGGKYQRAAMAEALPEEFQRRDGTPVKFSWLSAGTKDAFALALRLAMARYFLGGNANGFLLIDDPLVNMDPERQKIAAEMLRDFARERQVVVFTCHPSHAELLGGTQVRLL